ncbi:MAG: hypothetical protein EPN85_14610 [Bacteroidetes bacterium]|nr:MAG: hypothetical protein EPN85_14610 [Bacteroidota bacterium]
MEKTYPYKKYNSTQKICLGLYFFLPVLFALFLMPTKYASLTQKLHIPPYFSPQNLLFGFISLSIIITIVLNQKFTLIPKHLILSYLGFAILVTTGIFYSSNPHYGQEKTIEFLTSTTLACFAPFFLFRNLNVFERFLKTFIVLSILLSIFIFASSPYSFRFYNSNNSYPQFQTTIGNNYLALQYIVGISLLTMIYYFLFKQKIQKKIIFLAVLLCGLFAAALLYSPGKNPILSLFLTVVIMTFLSLKIEYQKILMKRKTLTYAVLIFLFGALLLSTIGWMFVLRLQALLQPGYYGQVERVENTKNAIDVFLNHPFFGAGIGSFSDYAAILNGIERMRYPHNIFLELASEMGFAGLLLFILILGFAFKQLFYLTKKYRPTQYYPLPNAVLSFLIFTFLTSLTGGNINNPLLFVWIGIAYILEPIIIKCMRTNNSLITGLR